MFSTSPLDWGLVLAYFGFLAAGWHCWRPGMLKADTYLERAAESER